MKKNLSIIMIIALALLIALTGCSPDNGGKVTTRNIRVVGTAVKATSTSGNRAIGDTYVLDSVDSIKVNGTDIKDKFVPADPSAIKGDKQNNVTFVAEVDIPTHVSYTAEGKTGYVFDEWEVLEEEDENATVDPEFLEEIEDWLEDNDLEHEETLRNVPSAYIPYLVAEYDNGYYIDLGTSEASTLAEGEAETKHDGSKDAAYTVDEFKALNYSEDEVTLIILGNNTAEFEKLMAALGAMEDLEELKLKAENAELAELPAIAKLEEISLTGFKFTAPIAIDSEKNEYKFVNCTFDGDLNVKSAKEIELKGCTAKDITVTFAEEVEIEGGTYGNIIIENAQEVEIERGTYRKITVKGASEVEIEDATVEILDFTAMTEGEVELEKVKHTELRKSTSENVTFTEK